MNWDQIAGKWSQLKGGIRQKWGKLTDDDMEVIAGGKDKFVGMLQVRYGIAKEEAERQINDWLMAARPATSRSRHRETRAPEEQARPAEGMPRNLP